MNMFATESGKEQLQFLKEYNSFKEESGNENSVTHKINYQSLRASIITDDMGELQINNVDFWMMMALITLLKAYITEKMFKKNTVYGWKVKLKDSMEEQLKYQDIIFQHRIFQRLILNKINDVVKREIELQIPESYQTLDGIAFRMEVLE